MGFQEAVASGFSKYVQFSGRAARSEYWYWVLFIFLAGLVLSIIDSLLFGERQVLSGLFSLATLLPNLAIGVRRLHDIGRTGWWLLLLLVPVVGIIVIIIFAVQRGTAGANTYGPDPLAGTPA